MMYRRYRRPGVWREFDRMQRDMNRLFEDYIPSRSRVAPAFPPVNVWKNEEELVVSAEVPGISTEDMEINVVGEMLELSGERKSEDLQEGARYHRQERGSGKFNRTIQLPFPVDVENVEATFTNGVLNVTLPRAEADKPRKIAVKAV